MAKTKQLLLFLLLFSGNANAQSSEYTGWVKKAMACYDAKQYQQSADAFTKAFASFGGKGNLDDRYNAACSWAQAGNKDSAFFMLTRIATKANYSNLPHLLVDGDLTTLHADKRWDELCAIVKQNKDKAEAGLDKALVATLDSVMEDDQGGRMQLNETSKKYGHESKEMKDLWNTINYKDSVDLIKIIRILDKYGWPGPEIAGTQGSMTVFLVIQHSDIKTQEKYLPLMRAAVEKGKAQPSSLAMLEDRVALREDKKQIYGSQIGMNQDGTYYVDLLDDPDNVDKRRATVGLPPLADYVQHWGLTWDPEAYKKQLAELEKRKKETK